MPFSYDKLTPKELDCIRLVARNRSSKEIAHELGRSEHTVNNQLRTAMQKTGVTSRRGLATAVTAHEEHGQKIASHPLVMVATDSGGHPEDAGTERFREERSPFLHKPVEPVFERENRHGLYRPYERAVLILLTGVLAILGLSFLKPLTSSAEQVGAIIKQLYH